MINAASVRTWTYACLFLLFWAAPGKAQSSPEVAAPPRYSQPELFTYDELQILSKAGELSQKMQAKLDQLLTTPFISNEARYRGAEPIRPTPPGLGSSLRIVAWNIERGFRLDSIIFALQDPESFLSHAAEHNPDLDQEQLREEMSVLQGADVFILNEADWGLKRSEYQSVARTLAEALEMNWAYGVEFLEVDPVALGTEEFGNVEDDEERQKLVELSSVDPKRVQALHGTAVLSRYPILDARVTPFELQPYDWFDSEKSRISPLEKGRRQGAELLLAETISREIRRGGRMFLTVDLAVPDVEEGRISVVATHLEIRAEPEQRRTQMEEILAAVKAVRNPVIIAGDMNTSGGSSEPTSLKRELLRRFGNESYWTHFGIKQATGFGLLYDLAHGGINFFKNLQDPTAENIPLLAPNPEEKFFKMLEGFRFDDGMAFDFRGVDERTVSGYGGTLGNSNERDTKGFVVTFEVDRTFGPIGKAKLDWIFVKPYIEDPNDDHGPYIFAPHYGRTLEEFNEALDRPLSDHRPISVDLPFADIEQRTLTAIPRERRTRGSGPLSSVGDGAESVLKTAGTGLEKVGSAVKEVFGGNGEKDKPEAVEAPGGDVRPASQNQ